MSDQGNNGDRPQITDEQRERSRSEAGNVPPQIQTAVPEAMRYDGMPMTEREQEIYHAGAASMLAIFSSQIQGMPPEALLNFGQMVSVAVALPGADGAQGDVPSPTIKRVNAFVQDCMAKIKWRLSQQPQSKVIVAKPGDIARAAGRSNVLPMGRRSVKKPRR